jgi:hypothetical protein
MREAYRQSGHKYLGRNVGRGGRQYSKIVKALKGMATFQLLDAVAREDARRRREQVVEREQVGNLSPFQA